MKIRCVGVRMRLTLWYTLALALIVFVFSVSVYVFVKGRLFHQLDRQLDGEFSVIAGEITEEAADLRELDPVQWRREISVAFQDYAHYALKAWEKIVDRAEKAV